jgi:hypothetical protein
VTETFDPWRLRFFIAAVAYLIAEFAFNIALLETAGNASSMDRIHTVETIGRILSGLGLSVVVLKLLVARRPEFSLGPIPELARTQSRIVFGVVAVSVAFMYTLQTLLIGWIVSTYEPVDRQRAASFVFTAQALAGGKIDLAVPPTLDSSERLVLHALLPFMQDGTNAERARAVNRAAVVREIDENLKLATPVQRRELYEAYVKAFADVQRSFAEYRDASNRANARLTPAALRVEQDNAWGRYVGALRERRYSLPVNRQVCEHREGARVQLRRDIPTIPGNWDCNDRETFDRAVARHITSQVNAQWRSEMQRRVGGEISRGLPIDRFVSTVEISGRLQREMPGAMELFRMAGYRHFPLDIRDGPDFVRKVIEPARAEALRKPEGQEALARAGIAEIDDYAPDGAFAEAGSDAVRALVAPPIALAFSLFFFLVNLSGLAAGFLPGRVAPFVSAGAIAAILALPFFGNNGLTTWPAYASRIENVRVDKGAKAALAIDWLARAQPVVHRAYRVITFKDREVSPRLPAV